MKYRVKNLIFQLQKKDRKLNKRNKYFNIKSYQIQRAKILILKFYLSLSNKRNTFNNKLNPIKVNRTSIKMNK